MARPASTFQRGLRPGGTVVHADKRGRLPRIGRRPNGEIAEVINQLDQAARSLLGDEVIALLVRGSVARGGARDAMDLDLVLITREREEDDELWHGLPRTGPLPVEWSVLPLRQLCEAPSQARLRFALAHGGVTWSGPDVVGALPTPVLGPHIFMHLRGLRSWSRAVRVYWDTSVEERRAVCRWAAKRTVRALAEPELSRLRIYSRDLWPCMTIAARAHPKHRMALLDMASLAVRPVADLRTLEARLATLRTPLLSAYGRAFGRHPLVRT